MNQQQADVAFFDPLHDKPRPLGGGGCQEIPNRVANGLWSAYSRFTRSMSSMAKAM